jgi:hypothetical protein
MVRYRFIPLGHYFFIIQILSLNWKLFNILTALKVRTQIYLNQNNTVLLNFLLR